MNDERRAESGYPRRATVYHSSFIVHHSSFIIPMLPFTSIIIPTYNGKALLATCLPALRGQTYPADRFEVIVVDDASSDGTLAYLAAEFPEVRVVALAQNSGFIAACNAGVAVAQGERAGAAQQRHRGRAGLAGGAGGGLGRTPRGRLCRQQDAALRPSRHAAHGWRHDGQGRHPPQPRRVAEGRRPVRPGALGLRPLRRRGGLSP